MPGVGVLQSLRMVTQLAIKKRDKSSAAGDLVDYVVKCVQKIASARCLPCFHSKRDLNGWHQQTSRHALSCNIRDDDGRFPLVEFDEPVIVARDGPRRLHTGSKFESGNLWNRSRQNALLHFSTELNFSG